MQRSPTRKSPRLTPSNSTMNDKPSGSKSSTPAGTEKLLQQMDPIVAGLPFLPATTSTVVSTSAVVSTTAASTTTNTTTSGQGSIVSNSAQHAGGFNAPVLPNLSPSNSGNVSNLESLQTQINCLQAQLLNAQNALKVALTNNLGPSSSRNLPPQIDGMPPFSNEAYLSNSAAVNVNAAQLQNMASLPSVSAASTEINPSQPPYLITQQPQLFQNVGSTSTHKKLYDLPEFNGAPEDWPMSSTAFSHSTVMYQYNNFENCLRLQKALKGEARDSVKSLLIHSENVSMVIEQLGFQYGRPEMLIRCQLQQVNKIQPINEDAVERLIPFAVKVQNLAAFLENANAQQHLANPTLMEELVGKLPMSKRLEWAQYSSAIKPYPTVLHFNNWLKGVAELVRLVQNSSVSKNIETKRKVVLHTTSEQRKQQECPICQSNHKIWECKKFVSLSVPNRWNEVKKLRLCFSCLGVGHSSRICRRRTKCQIDGCERKHSKLLHETRANGAENNLVVSEPAASGIFSNNSELVLSCTSGNADKGVLLFRVVPVVLYGPNNKIETYALLDEGSSVTMVDSSLLRELGIRGQQSKLNLHWYAGTASQEMATVVDLHVSGIGKQRKYDLRNVYGVSKLKLPAQSFNMDLTRHQDLPIKLYNNVVPKVLIGLDHCHLGLPNEILPLTESGPYAANTPLGWIVFGRMPGMSSSSNLCLFSIQPEQKLYDLVANYFDTENFGVKILPVVESSEDMRARNLLNATKKIGDRYQSRLLWRTDDVVMPDIYSMALNRLFGIERKMNKNSEFAGAYKTIMKDYVSKKYVRKLSLSEVSDVCPKTWYLPHFGVVNPNKPGKTRLVFDAAATVEGVSLNSYLLKGPQQYKPLPTVLFNFRVAAVAVCADIKEMFHQISVAQEDRCSQRFLWREDPNKLPDVYEMLVMTFGAACSPCVAHYVKETNALLFRNEYPRAVKSIIDHHYVDDFVDCFETPAQAIEITKQVRNIHKSGGFELRNFSSNSMEVVMALKGSAGRPVSFSNELSELQSEKVLGMFWHPSDDTFRYKLKFHKVKADVIEGKRCPTKRELLSVVMSIFDPLGFLSHFMITAKLLMREVWRHDVRWDEPLPSDLNDIWNNWRNELKRVVNVIVPRYYFGNGVPHRLELHMFVDASEDAFGAVAYWRSFNSLGNIEVSFVAAKTKCAPMKIMSIPRLELQAAVLGTRLVSTILKEHSLKVCRRFFWSDSTTVISWIGSESRRYKPFVAHRIAEILEYTSPAEWRWLPTKLNVADETTRMKNQLDFTSNSRWFKGPNFLYSDENEWPETITVNRNGSYEEELRPKYTLLVHTPAFIEFNRFSSFLKLKRTVAWILRFVNRCQKKIRPDEENGLTAAEIKTAEVFLCQLAQKETFYSELELIKKEGALPKSSELFTLSPYIDNDSLLRVYGRIDAASWLPFDSKRPVILPTDHPVTVLYLAYVHEKMKHQNFEATVCEIRRWFWIPRLRKSLRKCISNCFICRFNRTTPVPPLMGSLPKDRLTPYVRPFSYTGLDYFGPITITIGRRHEKRWVALFTCLTTRAIHLEVAFNLSTDACILAIRNFINRRGTPNKLRSDNGKNFVGADQVSKRFSEVFDVNRMQDELSTKNIDWQFNCPYNPAEGGAWERMVQCVKRVLRSTLKESSPHEHTLQSFLIEAENIVNSRPLTHLPLGHEDEEPLTPNHFLLGAPNTAQTPVAELISDEPAVLRKQWRISRQLRDHFWRRWVIEYLPTLTRRSKWCQRTKPIAVGDLVLICDPAVSRKDWRRGRVVQVHSGRDDVIRRADVQTSSGVLKRPVSKLAVLDLM